MIAFLLSMLAIPGRAAEARDWVLWVSVVVGGFATIWTALWAKRSPVRRMIVWLFNRNIGQPIANAARGLILEVLKPDLDLINVKVDELGLRNDLQHMENARSIAGLRADLNAHMAEAETSREQVKALVMAADMHVAALRSDLASPGLPADK